MNDILLMPPVAFIIIFVVMGLQFLCLALVAAKGKAGTGGKTKAYACGEDVVNPKIQPDYSQFFQFAFFFTIMDVVGLMVATVPNGRPEVIGMAAFYLLAAVIGLFILYRR